MPGTLWDWFNNPKSTLLMSSASYNPPSITVGLLGSGPTPAPTPQPLQLYDLTSFSTPFNVVWNRPNNVLQK